MKKKKEKSKGGNRFAYDSDQGLKVIKKAEVKDKKKSNE